MRACDISTDKEMMMNKDTIICTKIQVSKNIKTKMAINNKRRINRKIKEYNESQ